METAILAAFGLGEQVQGGLTMPAELAVNVVRGGRLPFRRQAAAR